MNSNFCQLTVQTVIITEPSNNSMNSICCVVQLCACFCCGGQHLSFTDEPSVTLQ